MKAEIIVLLCVFFVGTSLAQAPDTLWTKTFGGSSDDIGYALQQTADGGYIVAGCTESFGAGDKDVYLIRTDADGGTIWTKYYGGPEDDVAYAIQEHWDGDYLVAGYTNSFGAGGSDIWILKIDAAGDTLWTETYGDSGNEIAYDIASTSDSGYVITGGRQWIVPTDTGYAFLMKFDLNSDSCWLTFFETPMGGQEGFSVIQIINGEYMICGATWPEHPCTWITRADSNGYPLWGLGHGAPDNYACIREIAPDTFVVVGPRLWGCCGIYVTIRIVNGTGDVIWEKIYTQGFARAVEKTEDGSYVIAGEEAELFGPGCVWLIKTNQDTTLWTTVFGSPDSCDGAYAVQITPDNGYTVVGYTNSFGAGGSDVWLLRTEPDTSLGISTNDITPEICYKMSIHPNPFSRVTEISFSLPRQREGVITLGIHDATGRLVKSFETASIVEYQAPTVIWDGKDHTDRLLPSGVYFLRLSVGDYSETRKLLLIR